MNEVQVEVRLLHEAAHPPAYAHQGDAGADLRCVEGLTLAPGERRLVATGVAVAIPAGYAGLVHPRSGLAHRHGLSIVNAPGTVDSGYRGEIFVNLINLDPHDAVQLEAGERIAQLVIVPVARAQFVATDDLSPTDRGVAGHGSTGRR